MFPKLIIILLVRFDEEYFRNFATGQQDSKPWLQSFYKPLSHPVESTSCWIRSHAFILILIESASRLNLGIANDSFLISASPFFSLIYLRAVLFLRDKMQVLTEIYFTALCYFEHEVRNTLNINKQKWSEGWMKRRWKLRMQ